VKAKRAYGHGMDKTLNPRKSIRTFYVPKCVKVCMEISLKNLILIFPSI
jgi:hypothetical protein